MDHGATKLKNKEDSIFNSTLDKPNKINFESLKTHLWNAADILRGIFLMQMNTGPSLLCATIFEEVNYQFEEKAEELERKGKLKKDEWIAKNSHAVIP